MKVGPLTILTFSISSSFIAAYAALYMKKISGCDHTPQNLLVDECKFSMEHWTTNYVPLVTCVTLFGLICLSMVQHLRDQPTTIKHTAKRHTENKQSKISETIVPTGTP